LRCAIDEYYEITEFSQIFYDEATEKKLIDMASGRVVMIQF